MKRENTIAVIRPQCQNTMQRLDMAEEDYMIIYNIGYVRVDKKDVNICLQTFAKHRLSPPRVSVDDENSYCLDFDEERYVGDIESELRVAVEELACCGIYPKGEITYYGDYEGRYEIGNGEVITLSHEECIVHDMADEEVIEEARRRGLYVVEKKEDERLAEDWRTIKKDGPPPVGSRLIVTIKNHGYGGRRELRYPVYYLERTYEPGHGFYFGDLNNMLLPEYSEVIAWMPFPTQYEGEA